MKIAPRWLWWLVRRFGRTVYSRDWQYIYGGGAVRTPRAYQLGSWLAPSPNCSTTRDEWVVDPR